MKDAKFEIRNLSEWPREVATKFFSQHWGAPVMVSKGRKHQLDELPGYGAVAGEEICGLVTYHVVNGECEIVSLDSFRENQGVGGALLDKVVQTASEQDCSRIWLITTNDNTRALRFYQKRGFNLRALYLNVVQAARRIKPEIPLLGNDGIPILHELELERFLQRG